MKSIRETRHHLAMLRKCQRCLENNIGTKQDMDVRGVCASIDYIVDLVKRMRLGHVAVCLLFMGLFCSCATKVVTVPDVHTEYLYRTDSFVQRDSIHVKDSVFVVKNGDTVTIERTKILYRDRCREVVKVDSFVKRDSIPYPVEVEKKLSWWDRQKIALEGMLKLLAVGFLFFVFIKLKK